jgi:long-chain fatty acid transport protein
MGGDGMPRRQGARRVVWSIVVAAALVPSAAGAGGLLLYEVGTSDIGYASAGWAARATSPVTLLSNPAGMTRLSGVQVEVGTELLYANLTFAPDALTSPSLGSNNGGNAIGALPSGGVFATFAPWKDIRFGLGVFNNFGAPERWDPAWVGRYYTTKTSIIGVSIMPAVAWHIVDGLSVGATFQTMYGRLRQTVAIKNLESQVDGNLSVSSDTWGFGGNFGVLYEFSPGTRLGLTYTSPLKLNFSAPPTFTGLGPLMGGLIHAAGLDTGTIDLGMTVPQTVMLSFFHTLSSNWAVMADFGWQNWAAFGTVEIGVTTDNPQSLTKNVGYTNTWHGALGAQVQLSEQWQLNFGIAYDSTMTTAENRTLMLALADQWRFGVGAQLAASEHWDLGFTTEFLWDGSPSVVEDRGPLAGHVSGNYNSVYMMFFSFHFTWKS